MMTTLSAANLNHQLLINKKAEDRFRSPAEEHAIK